MNDENSSVLRLLTCGSVDDGKSTLIGRILHDCDLLYDEELKTLENERTAEGLPDFSALMDGLLGEREQAITIDVAYRSFATANRRYLVADAPGHEQYTRNMVTGASRADAALLLVDATKAVGGLLPQTKRHTYILSLVGVPHIIVAINKMDVMHYSREVFSMLEKMYREYAADLGFKSLHCIPVSALRGDNVKDKSAATDWYSGKTLLETLEAIEPVAEERGAFRMPVQLVSRIDDGSRCLSGTIVSGQVAVGDEIAIQPSGVQSTVRRITTMRGDREVAVAEDAVNVQLATEVDVWRGDLLSCVDRPPEIADSFSARMVWLNDPNLVVGRTYIFRLGTTEALATVAELSAKIDLDTRRESAAKSLGVNDLGRVKLILNRPVPLAPYKESRDLGGFILVDRLTSRTLGAGMIEHSLRRSHNVLWQDFAIDKKSSSAQKGQKPFVLWFTGLSASGKSTVANLVAQRLFVSGKHLYSLDGDNLRHGLCNDLGFAESDRAENIRRAAEVACLMVDAGLIVLASFITPYEADRRSIRDRFEADEFLEIYVKTPIEVCAERDFKGLYKKAFAGELPNFTGVTAPFEEPVNPEITLDGTMTPEGLSDQVIAFLQAKGLA